MPSNDAESAEQVVGRHIDSEETILWAGRPNVNLIPQESNANTGGGARFLILLIFIAAVIYTANQGGAGVPLPRTSSEVFELMAQNPVPVAVLLGMIALWFFVRAKGWKPGASHANWLQTLVYAITDRRVLIIEDGKIGRQLGPEDFGALRVRDCGEGHADIDFQITSQAILGRGKDRRHFVFMALPNAADVKHRIEAWRNEFRQREESEVASFVDNRAGSSGPGESGVTVVRNPEFGLTMSAPETWKIEVRKRRKPYGKVFLDLEKWQRPEDLSDWNVLRAEGDFHASIEIHLDRVPKPVIPYEKALNSTIAGSVVGKVIESDEALRWGRFSGHSVTRGQVVVDSGHTKIDRNRPTVNRYIVLHDGQIQIGVNMTWPDGSEPLRQAVHKVFESMEFD